MAIATKKPTKQVFKVGDIVKPIDQYPKVIELVGLSFNITAVKFGAGKFDNALIKCVGDDIDDEYITSSKVLIDQLHQMSPYLAKGEVSVTLKVIESGANPYYTFA